MKNYLQIFLKRCFTINMLCIILSISSILSFPAVLNAQYVVSDLSDLPDDDLDDDIWSPRTLRAAIQNINKQGIPAKILITPDNSTISLVNDLPVINVPVEFDGKGLTLQPSTPAARFGLWITSNNSIVRNVKIINFNETGLVWQGSDGLIEKVICAYNGLNLNMNNAHRNTIGSSNLMGYYSNYFYGAKDENGGFNISLVGLFADSVDGGNNDNIIQYCSIGVDENGIAQRNTRSGLHITNSKRNHIHHNLISGNNWNGIEIDGTYPSIDEKGNFTWKLMELNTLIENNFIGTNGFGSDSIPNLQHGIQIASKGDIIRNNIVSGNMQTGIYLSSDMCENMTIENNKVGTDRLTKISLPNGNGITIYGRGHKVTNNIISGNKYTGLSASGNNLIVSNIIGLDEDQKIALPNGTGFVSTHGQNLVFGGDPQKPNIIAGNNYTGISINGAGTDGVEIKNNIIGENSNGIKFPNNGDGIFITHSSRNVLIENNKISEQGKNGIRLERNVVIFLDTTKPHLYQKPSNITIRNNEITGEFGESGISIFNADSILIQDNIIEGASRNGISIENDSTKYIEIYNNQIGPDYTKPESQRIGDNSIYIDGASQIMIGDDALGSVNYIKNCNGSGVYMSDADSVFIIDNNIEGVEMNGISIYDSTSEYIRISKNVIGPGDKTDPKRLIIGDGIFVDGARDILIGNQITPVEDANIIQYCMGHGLLAVNNANNVNYFGNIMIENEKGGIGLDDIEKYYKLGRSNDPFDADSGSNGLQNTPSVFPQIRDGGLLVLNGEFKGQANTTYRLDVYLAKDLPAPTKHKTQGTIYLGWFTLTTSENGIAVIDTSWSDPKIEAQSPNYSFATLTATSVEGTSQFSLLANASSRDVRVSIDTAASFVDETGKITLVAKIINIGDEATVVSVRDTTSNMILEEVEISKGVAMIVDSAFIGTFHS